MKRILAVVALLALVAGGMWYRHVADLRVARSWQPLPDGGEVRLLTATLGPVHRYQPPGPPLSQRIGDAMRWRSMVAFAKPPAIIIDRSQSPEGPGLLVWLELRRNRKFFTQSSTQFYAQLILPDGRSFSDGGGQGGSSGGSIEYDTRVFDYIPMRAKTLRYACKFGEQRFEFEFDNPAYRTHLPVWKAAPLPQTQQSGDVALTLNSLTVERFPSSPYSPERWEAHPVWTITKSGQPADRWFQINTVFEDPSGQTLRDCGLLSEPVWKVRCTASRTGYYPFRDEEIRWLGSAGPEAPPEQTAQLFPVDPKSPPHGFKLAGVFGPGEYWYQDGVIAKTAPPKTDVRIRPNVEEDYKTKQLHIVVGKAAVVLRGSELFILRDTENRPARFHSQYSSHSYNDKVGTYFYDVTDTPNRIGIVDLAEPRLGEFQFLIPTPEKPELK